MQTRELAKNSMPPTESTVLGAMKIANGFKNTSRLNPNRMQRIAVIKTRVS